MNSDTSGGKRADSAPALADGANKRSPRAFVCMNIVSGAPVQNINNAGGGRGWTGGGRQGRQNKYLAPTMGSFRWLCYQLCYVGETTSGPGSLLLCDDCQLWKICRNFWKVFLPRNGAGHPFICRANLKAVAGWLITNRNENISRFSSRCSWTFIFLLNWQTNYQQASEKLFGRRLNNQTAVSLFFSEEKKKVSLCINFAKKKYERENQK